MNNKISLAEVEATEKQWADSVLAISQAYGANQGYEKLADDFVSQCYGYDIPGQVVLFKPTKAVNPSFRSTKQGAVSYFIGGDDHYPEDGGFALHPWEKITFNNDSMVVNNELTLVMGECYLIDHQKECTTLQYSLGLTRFQGGIKLILHHSSFPYSK